MTSTKGTGILNTEFEDYAPYRATLNTANRFPDRFRGRVVRYLRSVLRTGSGTLFIGPGEKVYAGMVIGQNGKAEDIELNVCKTKHLTNTRTSSSDEALRLTPPRILSWSRLWTSSTRTSLEVTPVSLRIRKKELDSRLRKRAAMK